MMTSKPEPVVFNNPLCRCDDCQHEEHWETLGDIEDIGQRINAGHEVPAGECSECGCFSYLVKKEE